MRRGRTPRSSPGRLALLLMVIWAGTHSVAGSALVASALAFLAHDHPHSASLSSEGGHVDLVLAHVDEADRRGGDRGRQREHPAGSLSEAGHVVHLASDDAPLSTSRRPLPGAASAPSIPVALLLPSSRRALAPPPAPCARGRDLLEVVVLRL
jgi:hypothetical protein